MIASEYVLFFVKSDDWSEMLLTASMLVEAAPVLQAEIVAEEQRRGISRVVPFDGEASDDGTLYVSDASTLEGARSTPRNLVVVGGLPLRARAVLQTSVLLEGTCLSI